MSVYLFRFDKNILQICRSVNIWLLWTDSRLLPFGLAWCRTWPHHVCSYFWVLDVREWFLLPGLSSLGWIWSRWQPTKNRGFVYLKTAMAIRKYYYDEPLAVTLKSDLMNTHFPHQVVH